MDYKMENTNPESVLRICRELGLRIYSGTEDYFKYAKYLVISSNFGVRHCSKDHFDTMDDYETITAFDFILKYGDNSGLDIS
jgi:hypothetical protein